MKESTFLKPEIFQFRFFQRGCFSFLRNLFKRFKFGSKKTPPPQKKSRAARRKEMAVWSETLHAPTELITGEVLMARQTVWLEMKEKKKNYIFVQIFIFKYCKKWCKYIWGFVWLTDYWHQKLTNSVKYFYAYISCEKKTLTLILSWPSTLLHVTSIPIKEIVWIF